jgi:hypothetical protein
MFLHMECRNPSLKRLTEKDKLTDLPKRRIPWQTSDQKKNSGSQKEEYE